MKKIKIVTSLLIIMLVMVGCKNKETASDDKKDIKVAVVETTKVPMDVVKKELEKDGYNVEIVVFDANRNVIKAVDDKSVDAALGVHKGFMEVYNKENKAKLVMQEPYAYFTGIGLYSKNIKDVKNLPKNAKVAIMNDAMNMSKGLKMMNDAGVIKLKEGNEGNYSIIDIESNPKNIKFIDMDQTQTVKAIAEVDASICFFSHMRVANKDFKDYLIRDLDGKDFPVSIVVNEDNKDKTWSKKLAEGLRSKDTRKAMKEYYGDVYEYYE